MKTVFQKIIDKELPSKMEYEDAACIVIHDIQPQAPVHLLIIPKIHVERVSEVHVDEPASFLGHLLLVGVKVAKDLNLNDYRLVINNGILAGETVPHLHVHLLGGRLLNWPPG